MQYPKWQAMIYKTLRRKLKSCAPRTPPILASQLMCSRRVCSSCSTRDTRHVTRITNAVIIVANCEEKEIYLFTVSCHLCRGPKFICERAHAPQVCLRPEHQYCINDVENLQDGSRFVTRR